MQKINISLLAKYDIASDGLRHVFSGDNFDILASSSVLSDGAPVGEQRAAQAYDGSHVVIIDGGHSGFGIKACRSVAANEGAATVACCSSSMFTRTLWKRFKSASMP